MASRDEAGRRSAPARETNWAGSYAYRARQIHVPSTEDELRELVATRPRLRVLGSRHSFTDIADSEELVSLQSLPMEVAVDRGAMTVTVGAALRYGELGQRLAREQLALANLASLPHISVAGAVATATHGSGDRNGNLATSVVALELIASDGSVRHSRRGEPDFPGLVVGLGATGAVVRVTLEVEPAYEVRQRVFEGLAWESLLENLDAITASGYSVSIFSLWGDRADHVWVKSRVGEEPEAVAPELFGAQAATSERHVIGGLDPIHCTPQLGAAGPWSERLPHFRMGFTPSSGEEIQSEYLVAREQAVPAVQAVRELGPLVGPLLQISELRTVAGDDLWMSPQYGQDTVGLHFTWQRRPAEVARALAELEGVLLPLGARPHWGKLFLAEADVLGPRYPRLGDFAELLDRVDPRGAFRNAWLERHVLGHGA